MSEHITHIAVYEDSVRLMNKYSVGHSAIRDAIESEYDSGLFCSGTRGNHLYAIPILDEMRKKTAKGEALTEEEKMKLSGAIGWITHRAADLHVKPMFRIVEAENNPKFGGQVNSIYHDITSYKNVYKSGKLGSGSEYEDITTSLMQEGMKDQPAAAYVDVNALEQMMGFYWVSQLKGIHEIAQSPLKDFGDEALASLFKETQKYSEVWSNYIRAFNTPDPEEVEKYLTSLNFYDPDDLIIKVVRDIQDRVENDTRLSHAIDQAGSGSHYARMLQQSVLFIQHTDVYFNNLTIENETLAAQLRM